MVCCYNMMMKYVFSILLVLLVASSASAQPKLEIPSNKFDFGLMPDQSTVKHSFWFKSVGTDTVRIKEIKVTCQCMAVPLTQDWLAPGDSMPVSVFWNLGRRIGNAGQYPQVFIEGDEKPHDMSLIGQVVRALDEGRPVSVKPFKGEFAKTSVKSIDSIGIILTNHSKEDLEVMVVSCPVDECLMSFPEHIPAGAQASGYVKLKAESSDSEFMSSITLEFEGRKKSRLTIPLRRKIY